MIHVVIVTYNSAQVIVSSLEPLIASSEIDVTVVDNQSRDNTLEIIRSNFPAVSIVESGANLGFATAVNIGVATRSDEFVLLLNPDAVVSAKVVETMAERMRSQPNIGISAPQVVQPAGNFEILELGRFPSLRRVLYHYSGLSRFASAVPALEGQFLLRRHAPKSRDVDWVTGAVLMIRGDLLIQLGGVTERWFMYAEDIDLCYRAKARGYRVRYFHDLEAEHLMGASSGSPTKKTNSAPFVNLLDFYRLNMSPSPLHTLIWRSVVSVGLLSRASAYWIRVASVPASDKAYWRARAATFCDYAWDVLKARF